MLYPTNELQNFKRTPEWTRTTNPQLRRLMLYPIELRALKINNNMNIWEFILSGRQDSNLRPPAPKAGAITGLRYAPYTIILKKRGENIYDCHLKNNFLRELEYLNCKTIKSIF